MIITCNMCMDLVGLYKDKIASEDTVKEVDLHLKSCPKCREYYKSYDSIKQINEIKSTVQIDEEQREEYYNNISRRLRKRYKINTTLFSALTVITTGFLVFNIVKAVKNPKK